MFHYLNFAKMITLSCEFFGGFHNFFYGKIKKIKTKQKKILMYHTVQQHLVNFNFLSLKKNFWLSLLQNAKCYHIKTQQNLEFLGKFDGGAKSTWI
jgi:hypothetical protein